MKPGSKPIVPVKVFFFFFPILGLFFFKLPSQPWAVAFKSNLNPLFFFLVLRFKNVRAFVHSKNQCLRQRVFKYSDIKIKFKLPPASLPKKRPPSLYL